MNYYIYKIYFLIEILLSSSNNNDNQATSIDGMSKDSIDYILKRVKLNDRGVWERVKVDERDLITSKNRNSIEKIHL